MPRSKEQNKILKESGKNLMSCHRCRSRKVRCDFNSPCSNCAKEGNECVRYFSDKRRERYSARHVDEMQRRILHLESVLEKTKALVNQASGLLNCENDTSVKSSDVDDLSSTCNGDEDEKKKLGSDNINIMKDVNSGLNSTMIATKKQEPTGGYNYPRDFENYDSHTLSVYGPTSVFDNESIQGNNHDINEINKMNKDPKILNYIKTFFKWQYPGHNIFLYREAFLIDFFNPKPNCTYCSVELVLSICSIASCMVDDDRRIPQLYYDKAKSKLLAKLEIASIPAMQSFLLLAFYDISNGNNSSCWMLSGNGIRMGFDIGFQLNPRAWFLESNEGVSSLNVSIRSRIYWGCYVADHLISLLLGRPSLLKYSDASVPDTNDLPNIKWINEYNFNKPENLNGKSDGLVIYSSLNSLIKLINISDNMLNDVFTKGNKNRTDMTKLDVESRVNDLIQYNSRIMQWKADLPADLQWNTTKLIATADDPTLMYLKYYYYILILCLNRPFLQTINSNIIQNEELIPVNVCKKVLDELVISVSHFKNVHNMRNASIFIVYCSILSVSVLLLSNTDTDLSIETKERVLLFLEVLKDCSNTWRLAEKSYALIALKLEKDYNFKPQESDIKPSNINLEEKYARKTDFNTRGNSPKIDSSMANQGTPDQFTIDPVSQRDDLDYFGGPPFLMTSDLFNIDWDSLFPDYINTNTQN